MINDPFQLNRSAYDQIAPRFAEVNAVMSSEIREGAEKVLAALEDCPGRLLDLGCGAGRDLSWFTDHQISAVGSDLSLSMLFQSREICQAPLAQMDMRFLGFRAESFSAVWCVAALLHIPKEYTAHVLNEIHRILIPGGLLYLSVQKGVGEVIERDPYTGETSRFFSRFETDELRNLLQEANFRVYEVGEREGHRHWLWMFAKKALEST